MKKFEITFGIIALIGIVFKLFHILGGGILTVLSLSALSIFYCYLSFALFNEIRLKDIFKTSSYKETNVKRIIGSIGVGFGLSVILVGAMFRLQFYPGDTIQLLTGVIGTIIILTIAIVFYLRNKIKFYKSIFTRIIIIVGLGLLLLFTPKTKLVDIYYINYPDYANALKAAWANPNDKELWVIVNEERQKMNEHRK
jgi:hypothetical protein